MNKSTILLLLYIFLYIPCRSQSNVLFGERGNVSANKVFFDKEGTIYPNYLIQDSVLFKNDGCLSRWYKSEPDKFAEIAREYGCTFVAFSSDNLKILNDSIVNAARKNINSEAKNFNSITVLIHGFRKAYKNLNEDVSSPDDYNTLTQTIDKYRRSKTYYIEIYWDCMYGCCFSKNIRRNEQLFQLFEIAQKNAESVGKNLRYLIDGLSTDTLNVLTHSLGAKVAVNMLWNTQNCTVPIPFFKRTNICMVAPAIAGVENFRNYYKRTQVAPDIDNYRLAIVFNEKDFVLKKKDNKIGVVGPGPYKYGNTTLGCNFGNSAIDLKNYFTKNFPHSYLELINKSVVGKCHLVSCYCNFDNLKSASLFMSE